MIANCHVTVDCIIHSKRNIVNEQRSLKSKLHHSEKCMRMKEQAIRTSAL